MGPCSCSPWCQSASWTCPKMVLFSNLFHGLFTCFGIDCQGSWLKRFTQLYSTTYGSWGLRADWKGASQLTGRALLCAPKNLGQDPYLPYIASSILMHSTLHTVCEITLQLCLFCTTEAYACKHYLQNGNRCASRAFAAQSLFQANIQGTGKKQVGDWLRRKSRGTVPTCAEILLFCCNASCTSCAGLDHQSRVPIGEFDRREGMPQLTVFCAGEVGCACSLTVWGVFEPWSLHAPQISYLLTCLPAFEYL